MDLKKLKIDQLRKMVRRIDGARSYIEGIYIQVNRAKKQELIKSLEIFCTDSELESLIEETQSKPKDKNEVKIGQVRYVTNTSIFKDSVQEGDVFEVHSGSNPFDVCFYNKEKGWGSDGFWSVASEKIKSNSKVLKLKKDIPVPVINLAIEEARLRDEDINDVLGCIQVGNLSSFITWSSTRQGHDAWEAAHHRGDYTELLDWIKENKGEGKSEEPKYQGLKKGMMVSFAVELNEGTKVNGIYVNDDIEKLSKDESAVYIINYCKESSSGDWMLTFKGVDTPSWHYHESWFKIVGDWEETSDKRPPIGSRVEMVVDRDPLEIGDKGTVVGYYEGNDGTIYVEWDVYHRSMHDCDGLAKDGHGWNVEYCQVEVIKEEQKQEAKQQSKTEEKMNTEKSQMKLDLGIDLNSILTSSIQQAIGSQGDDLIAKQIKPLVEKEVAKLKPTLVKVPGRQDVTIEGRTHKKFKDILFLAQTERQVFLSGPSGSGKTFACSQVAKALSLPFSHISCSPGMSEAHLLGRMLFDGTYVPSDFVKCYENGGVFLFDEIDAADAGTLLVINSALANGHMSVPNRKENPVANRHEDFICICAGNTWGNGSVEYAGRNYMDAAFMDRFAGAKVMVSYDQDLEREICAQLGDEEGLKVFEKITNLREKVFSKKVRKVVSTRAFISATKQIIAGKKLNQFMNDFTIDWTQEEKGKVGLK